MAIKYLSNINLANNQLENFKVDNETSDPSGLAGKGQLIYRTDTDQLKYHTGSDTWVVVGSGSGSGTVTSITLGADSGSGTAITTAGTFTFSGGTNVTTSVSGTTVTINSTDQYVGTVTSVTLAAATGDKAGISLSGTNPITSSGTITLGVDIDGQTELSATAAGGDYVLIWDADADTNKKISVTNLVAAAPQGDITAVSASTDDAKKGITVANGTGPIPEVGLDIIGQTNLGGTPADDDELIVYDLSSTTNKSITVGNLKAASPQGTVTSIATTAPITGGTITSSGTIAISDATGTTVGAAALDAGTGISLSDSSGVYTVTNSGVTSNVAGTGISVSGATGAVTITNSGVTSIVAGTGISVSGATGAVTVTNTVTDTNYTYALSVGAVSSNESTLTLTGGGGGSSTTAKFSGTSTGIVITTPSTGDGGDITIGLQDDITVAGELTVSGTGQSSFGGQVTVPATPSASTDAASKGYVLEQAAGVGSFQGGYNATTNSPALSGGSNTAMNQGDFYVVSVAGTGFFTETLEVGDFIFADADIAASSSPAVTAYTVVIADENIAAAGATDGATAKGVAGFDSGNFGVTANGWVTIDDSGVSAASYGSASETLTATVDAKGFVTAMADTSISITASQVSDFCTAVETCADSNLTYAANIGDNSAVTYTVNHALGTKDVIVQIYDTSTDATIHADVVRTDTNNVTVTTVSAIATNGARVLVSKCA
jgi:hypothetical protein